MRKNLKKENCGEPGHSQNSSKSSNASQIKDFSSPYQKLGQIQRFSLDNNGEDDFSTPKVTKKIQKKAPVKKASKKTTKKNTNTILKYTKENFNQLDVNPEHLQMALALSKSTFAQEQPNEVVETQDLDLDSILITENIPKTSTGLERFGFKSSKKAVNMPFVKNRLEEQKKKKNSKFRFITPTLLTRTNEERESLINAKISQILQPSNETNLIETANSFNITSFKLKELISDKCWNLNDLNHENFIVDSLNLSPCSCKVGNLLKNWETIPGREKSPSRITETPSKSTETPSKTTETCNVVEETVNSNEKKLEEKMCTSPDLFEDSIYEDNLCPSPDLFKSSVKTTNKLDESYKTEDEKDKSHSELQSNTTNNLETSLSNKTDPDATINYSINMEELNIPCTSKMSADRQSRLNSQLLIEDTKSNQREDSNNSITDNKGIEYFESFYDPAEKSDTDVKDFVDLCLSSDDEDVRKVEDDVIETKMDYELSSLSVKRFSFDSGKMSLDSNLTKTPNITDYVVNILNSQDETENEAYGSTESQSFEISTDEELNYSSRISAQFKRNLYDLDNIDEIETDVKHHDLSKVYLSLKDKYNPSKPVIDEAQTCPTPEMSKTCPTPEVPKTCPTPEMPKTCPTPEIPQTCPTPEESKTCPTPEIPKTPIDTNSEPTSKISPVVSENPIVNSDEKQIEFNTPTNVIVKTENVTPTPKWDSMDTPKVREELDKYGIKPLKRQRGIQLLKYIYETTHPVVNLDIIANDNKEERSVKKRKLNTEFNESVGENIKVVGDELLENEDEGDLLFERRFSKKIFSCRIPLQIVWYNFLCCNEKLKESILLYEPIQLEVVYEMLKEQSSCNFHIEELITFLDKKCITFRTNQWQNGRKKQNAEKS